MKLHIHWFRRDLRLHDHRALAKAMNDGQHPVLPLFIFDTDILDALEDRADRRVHFIHRTLEDMRQQLHAYGSSMLVKYGKPLDVWKSLLNEYEVASVSVVRDYEPYAQERDKAVYDLLKSHNIAFTGCKDQVVFEKSEIAKNDGGYYSVFTPYSKSWKAALTEDDYAEAKVDSNRFYQTNPLPIPSLKDMGFVETDAELFPSKDVSDDILSHYHEKRDIPSVRGTSRLSVHLRFGTVSIRQLVRRALATNETFLNELIWRDFYQMTLFHNPNSPNRAIKSKYDAIVWENNEEHYRAWCEGKTGYPLVDAGMRELNRTGFMHNRIRMLTASFLTKHLLIDWRWGERYFAQKLLDFDLASNVGGWQWAAGCGNDAAPYFRIFNPYTQQSKFDPNDLYIKRYVDEYGSSTYPDPIVEHKWARERALERYKEALGS